MKQNTIVYLLIYLGFSAVLNGCHGGGGGDGGNSPKGKSNEAPIVQDFSVNTDEDTTVVITLAASDPEGDPITFTYTQPANGTLSGTLPDLVYSPNPDYHGLDSFTFTAHDGHQASRVATVAVSVASINDEFPVASDVTVSTDEDIAIAVNLQAKDYDNDRLTYSTTKPASGMLTGNPPNLTYTPNRNYSGGDTFTYIANDGYGDSNKAKVTISINPVNDPPVANAGADAVYNGGETVQLSGSATDVEGDSISYLWRQTSGPATALSVPDNPITEVMVPVGGGTMEYELTADDGADSNIDTVTITALEYQGMNANPLEVNPFVTHISLPNIRDVAIVGQVVYITSESEGLSLYYIQDINNLELLASYRGENDSLVGSSNEITVVDGYAYILNSGRMIIVNVADDPLHPVQVGAYDFTAGAVIDVAVSGNYAYVSHTAEGMVILDISDRSAPVLSASIGSGWFGQAVAVSGNYAYLATKNNGVQIIDVTDSTAPEVVSAINDVTVTGIDVIGTTVYLALSNLGFAVVDVSTPVSPVTLASETTQGASNDIKFDDNKIYIADGGGGVRVYDVSIPALPDVVGCYVGGGAATFEIAMSGSYVFAVNRSANHARDGVYVFNTSAPRLPTAMAAYDTGDAVADVDASSPDGLAYVSAGTHLYILDISNPPAMNFIAQGSMSSVFQGGVHNAGNFTYVSDLSGWNIFDTSDPANPVRVFNTSVGANVYDITYADSYAFVAASGDELQIYDVADPTNPALVGNYHNGSNPNGRSYAVDVHGDYAYTVSSAQSLQIFDITDRTDPVLLENQLDFGIPKDMVIGNAGRAAYVAGGTRFGFGGLNIVDISDVTTPTVSGNYHLDNNYAVAVSGGYAYLVDKNSGLHIVDISDPSAPYLAGLYPVPEMTTGRVSVSHGYAYFGGYQLYAAQTHVNLDRRYTSAPGGAALNYTLDWADVENPVDERVRCFVTGGSCAVNSVDTAINSADITWTAPIQSGDHEIFFAVGTEQYFITAKDRVYIP